MLLHLPSENHDKVPVLYLKYGKFQKKKYMNLDHKGDRGNTQTFKKKGLNQENKKWQRLPERKINKLAAKVQDYRSD